MDENKRIGNIPEEALEQVTGGASETSDNAASAAAVDKALKAYNEWGSYIPEKERLAIKALLDEAKSVVDAGGGKDDVRGIAIKITDFYPRCKGIHGFTLILNAMSYFLK